MAIPPIWKREQGVDALFTDAEEREFTGNCNGPGRCRKKGVLSPLDILSVLGILSGMSHPNDNLGTYLASARNRKGLSLRPCRR